MYPVKTICYNCLLFEALEYVNEKVLRLKMQLQLTMCNHAPEDQRVSYKVM